MQHLQSKTVSSRVKLNLTWRSLFAMTFFFLFFLNVTPASAAISFVQSASNTNSGNNTVSIGSGQGWGTPTSGNLLVASISTDNNNTMTIDSPADFTELTACATGGGGSSSIRMFYRISDGTETTITSSQANAGKVMAVAEYSGTHPSAPLDVENCALTASGTSHSTPTVSAAATGSLAVFSTMTESTGSFSNEQINGSTTGVTERRDATSGSAMQLSDHLSISSGNNTGSATSTANDNGGGAIAIFKVAPPTYSLSGVIRQTNESSAYLCATSGNLTVNIYVDNVSQGTATCSADTGAWSKSGLSATSGQTIYIFIDGGSVFGTIVYVSDGSTHSDLDIFQNRVILRDDANGSITNAEISTGNTTDADDLISFSGSDITVEAAYETHIYTGDTYAPGANVSTGFLHIDTTATYSAGSNTLTLTGTSGTLITRTGTFTQGTSNVTISSGSGTPTLLSAATTFHILTINSSATVINDGAAITINNAASAALTVTAGVLNLVSQPVGPGSGNGTLTLGASGTICLGGTSGSTSATCNGGATSPTAITMPTFQTYTFNAASYVRFMSDAATSISGTPAYGNLYFTPTITAARAYTFSSGVTINGDLNINPTASSTFLLSVNLGGTTTVASGKTTTLTGTTSGKSSIVTTANNHAFSTGLLDIQNPGTLDAGSSTSTITLTATSGTLFTKAASGTFTTGTSTVVMNPDAAVTLTSGTITFYNLSLTPAISTAGRTYTFGVGALTINGDFTIQPSGTQLLTVNMAGDITVAAGKTTTITRSDTATSKLVTGASNPALSSGNITIAAGGTLDGTSSSSNISLTATSGTPFTVTGTFTPGSTTVTYIPASGTANTVTSTTYYNLTLNHTGTTFSLTTSGITVTNDLTITAGVLDTVSGSNYPIIVGRHWTNSVGTGGFLAQNGTVTFNTTTTANITGATIFHHFTTTTAGKTIKFGDSTTFRINGTFTLTGAAGPSYVDLDSVSGGSTTWTINHQGTTENITYARVKNSACDGTSNQIDATDASNFNNGNNGTCWDFASTTTPTPEARPISHWKFDENTGSSANDSSASYTNTLTLSNTTWTAGDRCVSGNCLEFNGTTSTASKTYASDTELNPGTNNFTVSAWFRRPSSTPGSQNTLIARFNGGGYKIYMKQTTGVMCFGIDSDATWTPTNEACSTTAYNDSTWHHLVAVKNNTTSLVLYIDGLQVILVDVTDDSSISGTSPTFFVGVDTASNNYWTGFIDEVKYYNFAMTQAQVNAEKNARGSVKGVSAQFSPDQANLSTGLLAYYKLDEVSGNAIDSSGNSMTGTATGTTVVNGKFGNARSFTSTDQIAVSTISSVQTIAFWLYPTNTTTDIIRLSTSPTTNISAAGNITSTGITTPTYYINGKLNLALTANVWQHVTITTSTPLTADGILLGRISTALAGNLDEVRLYNRTLSVSEVERLYSFAPGPVGHWKMDENTGTSLTDASGNANSSTTWTGNPAWSSGIFGSSLSFIGNDSVVRINPTQTALDNLGDTTDSYTVETWFKITKNLTNAQNALISKWTVSGGEHPFHMYVDNNEKVNASLGDSGVTESLITTNAVSVNTWHHIALVRNVFSDTINLYIDGVLDATTVDDTTASLVNIDDISIGNAGISYMLYDLPGHVDEARIYNYARTSAQIIEDMNAGHPSPGSPVGSAAGYWKFDEGGINTCTTQISANNDACDSSPNAKSLSGPATSFFVTAGKFNNAVDGDGTSSFNIADADTGGAYDFTESESFSLSAWVNANTAGVPATVEFLVNKGDGAARYGLYFNTSGQACMGIDDDATWDPDVSACTSEDFYDTSWHHIVGVRNTTADTLSIYVDGHLKNSSTDTTTASLANGNGLNILNGASAADDEYTGLLDELKIYRLALSSDQIKVEYNRGSTTVLGALSTNSSGTASWSSTDSYCPPGEGTACTAPVAEWKMDENTAKNLFDATGTLANTVAFTAGSTPEWIPGIHGPAIACDGNDYATNNTTGTPLQISGNLTISFWTNISQDISNGDYILSYRKTSPTLEADNVLYRLEVNTASGLDIEYEHWYGVNNLENNVFDTNLNYSTWYHLALVRDVSANTVKLYINGIQTSSTFNYTNDPSGGTNSDFKLCNSSSGGGSNFNGKLDHMKFFTAALTPAQVAWDYNRGGPVGWWKFDETSWNNNCSSDTVFDSSGNSNNGDSCPASSGQTTPETGKYSTAIHFDDTDDYITIPDATSLDLTSGLSISAWVNTDANEADNIIVSKGTSYEVGINADGDVYWDGVGAQVDDGSARVLTGTWHHVVVTNDDTNLNIYVDGVKTSFQAVGVDADNATALQIGYDGTNYFDGLIDDVRIYNYALNATQVKTLYNENSAVRF